MKKQQQEIKAWKVTIAVLIGMLIFYIIFVQVWDLTSQTNKPENFLDFEVKTPEQRQDWFKRRTNGL